MAIRSATELLFPGANHTTKLLDSMPYRIQQGTRIPEGWVYKKEKSGFELFAISKQLSERKAIVFTVPGPFTPVCSKQHFPQFVELASKFKLLDIHQIACIAVANYDVMQAWVEQYGAQDTIMMVPDQTGEWIWRMGLGTYNPRLGFIAQRSAFYLQNGIVQVIYVDEDPKVCRLSSAQALFNSVYTLARRTLPKHLAPALAKE